MGPSLEPFSATLMHLLSGNQFEEIRGLFFQVGKLMKLLITGAVQSVFSRLPAMMKTDVSTYLQLTLQNSCDTFGGTVYEIDTATGPIFSFAKYIGLIPLS